MTAIARPASPSRSFGGPFAGFTTLLRKDARDWLATRRGIVTGAATTILVVLVSLSARIAANAGAHTDQPISLDPSVNLLEAGWLTLIPLIVVFATMGLVTAERERGTLAWVLSRPAARPAFLLSKAVAAFIALAVVVLAIPLAAATIAVTVAYGAPAAGTIGQVVGSVLPDIALYLALTLALGTFLNSQGGVAGIAIVLTIVPEFLAVISRDLVRYLPTQMDRWMSGVAQGQSEPALTPVIWAATVVALLVVGCVRLQRSEI